MQNAKQNSFDRRAHPRIDTRVKAHVVLPDVLKWQCIVGNFCPGGLYLDHGELDDGYDKSLVPRGERLKVFISIPNGNNEQEFMVDVKVAHAFEHGIGVAFLKNESDILRVLEETTQQAVNVSAEKEAPGKVIKEKKALRKEMTDIIHRFISAELPKTISRMEKDLLYAAEKSTSNSIENDYLHAAASIKKSLPDLKSELLEKTHTGMEMLFRQRHWSLGNESSDISKELTLIENDLFEEWIWMTGMVSSSESRLGWNLFSLEQRLGSVARFLLEQENNPVGPQNLSLIFKSTLDRADIGLPARRIIYKCLAGRMVDNLTRLYKMLNDAMSRHGIEEAIPRVKKIPQQAAVGQDGYEHSRAMGSAKEKADPDSLSGRYEACRSLNIQSERKEYHQAQKKHTDNTGQFEYGPNQVLQVLDDIPADNFGPLSARVLKTLNNDLENNAVKGALKAEVVDVIDVTDRLIDTFEHDPMLSPALRSPLAAIQNTLLKTVLKSPEFLTEGKHPAREVLNDLGMLSTFLSGTELASKRFDDLSRAINAILSSLSQTPLTGQDDLETIHEQLSCLIEKEREFFDLTVKRVIETCRGESRHRQAKFAVARVLKNLLASGEAPMVVANLLTLGWPSLLMLWWLKGGTEEPAWKKYTGVIERLLEYLDKSRTNPPDSREESVRLLKDIKDGLKESACSPNKMNILLKCVAKGLLGRQERYEKLKSKRIIITPDSIDKIVGIEVDPESTVAAYRRHGKWPSIIRRMKEGQWIVNNQHHGNKVPLKLVWKEKDASRFVFVNGTGIKSLDCNLKTLAEGFQTRQFSLMVDGDLPLVDRSIRQLLQATYEKNSSDVTIDHVTGLHNRRCFEEKLQSAIDTALDGKARHLLLSINIDQFELVKNAFGYEASNQLLKKIAAIIEAYRQESTIAARLGDSSFGILVQDVAEKTELTIAANLRTAIENYTFAWNEHNLSISASIGLVNVDGKAEDIYTLIRDADMASFLYKESGGGELKIYNSGDLELDRQRLLAYSASAIDKSIDQKYLRIYIQPIIPVKKDSGLHAHYEVLLRVTDKEGNINTPAGLIEAAEAYERMQILDKWVISSLFEWLATHSKELQGDWGFSINLSGQSIGKNEMLDFIISKLDRVEFPADRIAFEITETAAIYQSEKATEFIEKIRQKGCKFYLDDFGTGLSSFEYLKNYDFDCIKIDGCFIQNVLENEADQAMVKSITDIGHFMNRSIIAEFVENEQILKWLAEIGVDYAQGWGVGKPMPISDILKRN